MTILPLTTDDASNDPKTYVPEVYNVEMYHNDGCGGDNTGCTWYATKLRLNTL